MKAGLQVDDGVAGRAVQSSRGGREEEGRSGRSGVFKLGGRIIKRARSENQQDDRDTNGEAAAPELRHMEAQGRGRGGRTVPACSPGKPRRTDTLSFRHAPRRGFIRSPGSWFPICTVSCAKRGGCHRLQTPGWEARAERLQPSHWALPTAMGASLPHTGGHAAISMESTAVRAQTSRVRN